MKINRILVTGGAGYIGSHTCVELAQAGFEVICADNFANSSRDVPERMARLAGQQIPAYEVDLRDDAAIRDLLRRVRVDAIIHFAGLKAVGESVEHPLRYYENNLLSTLNLLKAMKAFAGKNIVFSSSAAVYSPSGDMPLKEDAPVTAPNPYGRTKVMIEDILRDLHASNADWNVSILRYFNPVGAHPSGLIGEAPMGPPSNLMPAITQVAAGWSNALKVFGGDYPTRDGTCIRDFLHVMDLARGHAAALKALENDPGCTVHNLGTGNGITVLEMIEAFERVNGVKVPHEIVARRPGDVAENYASTDKARRELHWETVKTLDDMVRDAWNWQQNYPRMAEQRQDGAQKNS